MSKYPRCKRAVAIACVIAVAGCATQPANVAPIYVSSIKYEGVDCKGLAKEAEEISVRTQQVTGTLQTKANTDAALVVGSLLFWPLLLATAATGGKQEEGELGRLKGEAEALARAAKAKGCDLGLPAPGTVAGTSATAPPTPTSTAAVVAGPTIAADAPKAK